MKLAGISWLALVVGLSALVPAAASADEAADKKAELQRKKDEAKKRAEEKAKAATADKKAAEEAAAAAKKAEDEKAAANEKKLAAEKAAAEKKAAAGGGGAASTGSGGATGAGGATAASTGGAGGKSSAGAGGASAVNKAELKDAPLPASDIEVLRKDRADRRKASVERLRKRWGSLLADAKGGADLKQHSRRVAFLQRVRAVAESKKDKKTIEAVDLLLTAEDDRHSSAMNSLREGALPAGTK